MFLKLARHSAAIGCGLVLLFSTPAKADEWIQNSFKTVGGGKLEFEYPRSWGRKPTHKNSDSFTDIQFGPFGSKAKPVFFVHLQAVVAVDPISDDALLETTKLEVEQFKNTAFETEIPINPFDGPNMSAYYFSITDKKSRRGEYDYLTMAVIRSGQLLIKCYFLSSDGAPDYGPDAMRMMRSMNYIAPPPEEEEEEK